MRAFEFSEFVTIHHTPNRNLGFWDEISERIPETLDQILDLQLVSSVLENGQH